MAGIRIIDNNRFASIEEGVKAALASGAEIVVACSSAKGIQNFISVKSNVLETLRGYQEKLGIKSL